MTETVVTESDVLLFPLHVAAARLSLSERTLKRLIDQGLVSVVRLGRSVRIHRDELERFAREGGSL